MPVALDGLGRARVALLSEDFGVQESGDHRVVDGLVLGQFLAAFQVELDNFGARS